MKFMQQYNVDNNIKHFYSLKREAKVFLWRKFVIRSSITLHVCSPTNRTQKGDFPFAAYFHKLFRVTKVRIVPRTRNDSISNY